MSYEKRPNYACAECHKSFKNQRALDAHNKAVHTLVEPIRDRHMDSGSVEWRRNTVCDDNAHN